MTRFLLALAAVALALGSLSTAEAGGGGNGGFSNFRFSRGFNRGFNRGSSVQFNFNRGGYGGGGFNNFQRNFYVPRNNVVFFQQPSYGVQAFAAPAHCGVQTFQAPVFAAPSYGYGVSSQIQFSTGGGYCGF